jgi:CheY-like chemotaxis protein
VAAPARDGRRLTAALEAAGIVTARAGIAAMVVAAMVATGSRAAAAPLDPLQQSVVDSLAWPARTTPPALLDAAVRAAGIEADEVAVDYLRRFARAVEAMGDGRLDLLADLGDAFGAGELGRLERAVARRDPAAAGVVRAVLEAADLRSRDPRRLAAAAAALNSDRADVRREAATVLARGREEALPALVDLLATSDADGERARGLARDLVRSLGPAARQPLLAWLGSDDVAHWPGVTAALAALGDPNVDVHLLAPALVADSPPEARAAAVRALTANLGRPVGDAAGAIERLTARLDAVLAPAGLPPVDHLLLEPVARPADALAAAGGTATGTVERFVWDPQAGRPVRQDLAPREARVQEALHLARDLAAFDARAPETVRLVMLARLEAAVLDAEATGAPAPEPLREALTTPDGFDATAAAEVLELAVTRGLWEAAAAAAAALEPPLSDPPADPLAQAARKALVRALAVPDPALQFAVARALVLAAGPQPWAGSSRATEILLHAATATGTDLAVVAHPDRAVAESLAAGVSSFGYRTVTVATGRDAILAARESADTTLVILAARTIRPTAFETVQFLRQQGVGGLPPVLVVVDPLDDACRGCFLTRLLLAFRGVERLAVVDRLDSFFAESSGEPAAGPRFPDALAQIAGPAAVDPASRAAAGRIRRARAREALALLARLGSRGEDVSAALDLARLTALHGPAADPAEADLHAPAVMLLAAIGHSEAQAALRMEAGRDNLPPATARLVRAALAANEARHGRLGCGPEAPGVLTRYTPEAEAGPRTTAGGGREPIVAPGSSPPPAPRDAPRARPAR